MCKYAPLRMKCVYEGCEPEPSFCKTSKLKYHLGEMVSRLPVIGKMMECPAYCHDFIGIPKTDDAWFKELMGK